jgi:hypothetical protein
MYVAIDQKPENGCEIQNAACGRSGVMLQIRLVKSLDEFDNEIIPESELNHGTKILKELVEHWARSNWCVCADSYFASVNAAEAMKSIGLRFIGVVKTATKQFPMSYLSNIELLQRGDFKGLVSKSEDGSQASLLSFVWMDCDRQYFIASASSIDAGTPY